MSIVIVYCPNYINVRLIYTCIVSGLICKKVDSLNDLTRTLVTDITNHESLILQVVYFIVIVRAQFSTETCVEINHHWKSAELHCGGGYISDVNVQSGTGKCLVKNGTVLIEFYYFVS